MATLSKGYLERYSGKIGPVVICQRKEMVYIRSMPTRIKRRKISARQRLHREKFALIQRLLRPINTLIKLGFNKDTEKRSCHNAAMSHNLKEAVQLIDGKQQIIWPNFLFSKDLENPALNAKMQVKHSNKKIVISWKTDPNFIEKYSIKLFQSIVLIYVEKESSFLPQIFWHSAHIASERLEIEYMDEQKPCNFHVYLAFFSTLGESRTTSNIYLGSFKP